MAIKSPCCDSFDVQELNPIQPDPTTPDYECRECGERFDQADAHHGMRDAVDE